jgi:hypothetical protein
MLGTAVRFTLKCSNGATFRHPPAGTTIRSESKVAGPLGPLAATRGRPDLPPVASQLAIVTGYVFTSIKAVRREGMRVGGSRK